MAKVDINVPNHFHAQLLAFLLVVYRGTPNDTVEFLHKKAPIAALKHSESRVVKALCHTLGWLLLELDQKGLFTCVEIVRVVALIEVGMVLADTQGSLG